MPGVQFLARALTLFLFLCYHVQTGSGNHPAFYPMGSRGTFPGVKRLGREAHHSHQSTAEVKESVELYFHFPDAPSRHGAQLKRNTGTTLPLDDVV